jgi:hypothetical protein
MQKDKSKSYGLLASQKERKKKREEDNETELKWRLSHINIREHEMHEQKTKENQRCLDKAKN